jgi:hypothetical protein
MSQTLLTNNKQGENTMYKLLTFLVRQSRIAFNRKKYVHFNVNSGEPLKNFYATLAYIRHFTFAGCYDNDPCDSWYVVTNFAGHLDFAGFYFSKCPANF